MSEEQRYRRQIFLDMVEGDNVDHSRVDLQPNDGAVVMIRVGQERVSFVLEQLRLDGLKAAATVIVPAGTFVAMSVELGAFGLGSLQVLGIVERSRPSLTVRFEGNDLVVRERLTATVAQLADKLAAAPPPVERTQIIVREHVDQPVDVLELKATVTRLIFEKEELRRDLQDFRTEALAMMRLLRREIEARHGAAAAAAAAAPVDAAPAPANARVAAAPAPADTAGPDTAAPADAADTADVAAADVVAADVAAAADVAPDTAAPADAAAAAADTAPPADIATALAAAAALADEAADDDADDAADDAADVTAADAAAPADDATAPSSAEAVAAPAPPMSALPSSLPTVPTHQPGPEISPVVRAAFNDDSAEPDTTNTPVVTTTTTSSAQTFASTARRVRPPVLLGQQLIDEFLSEAEAAWNAVVESTPPTVVVGKPLEPSEPSPRFDLSDL